jgi:hypothetical protein
MWILVYQIFYWTKCEEIQVRNTQNDRLGEINWTDAYNLSDAKERIRSSHSSLIHKASSIQKSIIGPLQCKITFIAGICKIYNEPIRFQIYLFAVRVDNKQT